MKTFSQISCQRSLLSKMRNYENPVNSFTGFLQGWQINLGAAN